MAILASVTKETDAFAADLQALEVTYPKLRECVAELEEFLRLDYALPEIEVDRAFAPRVYAIKLDYPPSGAAGRSQFLVIYHATEPTPSPKTPYRTFTMLRIADLHPATVP